MACAEGRAFLAAHDHGSLEVIDLKARSTVRSIGGLPEAQGVAVAGAMVLVTSGGDGKVHAFEAATLNSRGEFSVGADADNIHAPRLPVDVAFVAAGDSIRRITTAGIVSENGAALGSHPEGFAFLHRGLEIAPSRIVANVPATREVKVIDLKDLSVEFTWKLEDASANFPIAVQEIRTDGAHIDRVRIFVGCRKPASVVILDGLSGAQVARVSCGADVDDLFVDSAGRLLAVCGGDGGSVDVFVHESDLSPGRERWARAGRIATLPGARTGLLLPPVQGAKARLLVAAPARGDRAAELRIYEVK